MARYYNYDSMNRLHDFQTDDIHAYFKYDKYNRIAERTYLANVFGKVTETFSYDSTHEAISDGMIVSMQMTSGRTLRYAYDELQRVSYRHIYSEREGGGFWEGFTFANGTTSGSSTSQVSKKTLWIDDNEVSHLFNYTYDGNGNILTETDTTNKCNQCNRSVG